MHGNVDRTSSVFKLQEGEGARQNEAVLATETVILVESGNVFEASVSCFKVVTKRKFFVRYITSLRFQESTIFCISFKCRHEKMALVKQQC